MLHKSLTILCPHQQNKFYFCKHKYVYLEAQSLHVFIPTYLYLNYTSRTLPIFSLLYTPSDEPQQE